MDRNSAIGLTLIAALLLVYFYWFSPKPQPQSSQPVTTQSPAVTEKAPELAQPADITPDSLLNSSYGDFSSFARGSEQTFPVETEDVSIVFSSKGGIIKELELKKYKTYSQEPLKLVTPASNEFNLLTNYEGKDIDLYGLYYNGNQTRSGDTTVVTFEMQLSNGTSLKHIYSVPDKGYEIGYRIEQRGLGEKIAGNHLTFQWNDKIIPMEKDLNETRNNSTVTYYEVNDGFDYLTERSTGTELQTFSQPLKWVSIKQKFFLSAIIAGSFLGR